MYIFIAKLPKYFIIFNYEIFYKIHRIINMVIVFVKYLEQKFQVFYYRYGKIGLPAQIVWLLHKIRNIHYEQLYNC